MACSAFVQGSEFRILVFRTPSLFCSIPNETTREEMQNESMKHREVLQKLAA